MGTILLLWYTLQPAAAGTCSAGPPGADSKFASETSGTGVASDERQPAEKNEKKEKEGSPMQRSAYGLLVAGIIYILATTGAQAAEPGDTCEAGKNSTAG